MKEQFDTYPAERTIEESVEEEWSKLQEWAVKENKNTEISHFILVQPTYKLAVLYAALNNVGTSVYSIGKIKDPDSQKKAIELCKVIMNKQTPDEVRRQLAKELEDVREQDPY